MKPRLRLLNAWFWWSWLCGAAALGFLPAGLVAWFLAVPHQVSVHTGQQLLTPSVELGGNLVYRVTVEGRRACKGAVVDAFEALGRGVQVIRERPILSNVVEHDRHLQIDVPVPTSITPGPAHFKASLVSDCPEGRVTDVMIDTPFQVTQ